MALKSLPVCLKVSTLRWRPYAYSTVD